MNNKKDYLKTNVDKKDPELISVIDDLPLWSAPFGLRLFDIVDLKKNIKALDLGCGLGFPLIELSQRLGKTSHIYGLDPWNEALDRVRLKLQVYNIKNVTLVNDVSENMPFANEYFDLIVSNNGINNVQDIDKTLKECYRICKQNAQMVFAINTHETMIEFYTVFKEVLKQYGLNEEIKKMNAHIYEKRKPVEEIKSLIIDSGFEVNNIISDSFKLKFVDGSTMFNHYLIKYWFMNSWKEILDSKDINPVFEKVETRLNSQSEINGNFTLTIPFVTIDCRRK